jgi:hypothetical protein
MDKRPTAQVLWQITTATVERHVAVGDAGLSMSLRTHEVTMSAAATTPVTAAAETCADLELGAHVAQLRTFASTPPPSSQSRSRRLPVPLPRWVPEALEPV